MRILPAKLITILIMLLALLTVLLPGCSGTGASSQPIQAKLSFSGSPALGKPVQLTAVFSLLKGYNYDAHDVSAQIILPNGFEKVDGELEWKGDIIYGTIQSLSATVKSIKTGDWEVVAKAIFDPSKNQHYVVDAILYVSVSEKGATINDRLPGGNVGFAVTDPSQTPNPYASPIYTLPSPKPIEPWQIPTISPPAQSSSQPIQAKLSFSESPALGKPVQLTAVFSLLEDYNDDAHNVNAQIILPDGFEKVDGELEWKGDIIYGTTQSLRATVIAIKTGDWEVAAKAIFDPSNAEHYIGGAILYVSVSEKGAIVSDIPPEQTSISWAIPDYSTKKSFTYLNYTRPITTLPTPQPIDPAQIPTPSVFQIGSTPNKSNLMATLTNSLTITGNWSCSISEKVPSGQPANIDIERPMVWGSIYIFNARTGACLGSVCTGMGTDAGKFSIAIEHPLSDGFYIQARPISQAGEVKTYWMADYIAQPNVSWYPPSDWSTVDVGNFAIATTDDGGGAWRIYETIANDFYNRGAYYFMNYDARGPHYNMPVVTAIYPDQTPFLQTAWYNIFTKQLMIRTDEETKALNTVLHEYGHRVYHKINGDLPPPDGTPPILFGWWQGGLYDLDEAFSEGWADFFSLVVQDNYYYSYGTGSGINFENVTWNEPGWNNGDCVPGRITGSLWDFYDNLVDNSNPDYQYDKYHCGFVPIWNAFCHDPTNPTVFRTPDIFSEYWDRFKQQNPTVQAPAAMALYQNTIIYPLSMPGDANLDGIVNMLDITAVERYLLEFDTDPYPDMDANQNGIIDMGDVVRIERLYLGYYQMAGEKSSSGDGSSRGKALDSVATVSVDAPSQVLAGSDFIVNLNLSQVADLDTAGYDITFDPAILRLDDVTSGLIGSTSIPVDGYNERSPGTFTVAQNLAGVTGVSGTGTVAVLHFHVLGTAGQTSNLTLSNGCLGNILAEEIGADWAGDSVTVIVPVGPVVIININCSASAPPSVTTNAASNITYNSATLNGNLTYKGTAGTVNVYFEWGLTTDYGNTTTAQPKTVTGTFSDNITGLSPNITYHYRAKAVGDGTNVGLDQTFTTLSLPIVIIYINTN